MSPLSGQLREVKMDFPVPLIITLPQVYKGEAETLRILAESFPCRIHIRKPDTDEDTLRRFLDELCTHINRKQLSIHHRFDLFQTYRLGGFHTRIKEMALLPGKKDERRSNPCHSLEELDDASKTDADYVFLSPVFNSISKQGYMSKLEPGKIKKYLKEHKKEYRCKIVALGGIDRNNITSIKSLGFDGAALCGSVWETQNGSIDSSKSVQNYKKIVSAWE